MVIIACLCSWGLIASGCSTASTTGRHPITSQSPVQTAYAWFKSINQKDYSAAVAQFEPADRDMMDWGGGNTSGWPVFSHLRCALVSKTATSSDVQCTFKESQAADVGNPDSFWGISFHRQGTGPWLIDNYGQG